MLYAIWLDGLDMPYAAYVVYAFSDDFPRIINMLSYQINFQSDYAQTHCVRLRSVVLFSLLSIRLLFVYVEQQLQQQNHECLASDVIVQLSFADKLTHLTFISYPLWSNGNAMPRIDCGFVEILAHLGDCTWKLYFSSYSFPNVHKLSFTE